MTTAPKQSTVVVGVKAGGVSRAAIRLADREARYRDAELVAVMAYVSDRALGAPGGRPLSVTHTADDERLVAEESLRDALVDALGDDAVYVRPRVVSGLAGRQLIEAAREEDADLIVVASRAAVTMVPGTVAQYVLLRAPCPVLVVPTGVEVG